MWHRMCYAEIERTAPARWSPMRNFPACSDVLSQWLLSGRERAGSWRVERMARREVEAMPGDELACVP